MLKRIYNWARNREPLATVVFGTTVLAGAVAEVQGDLDGDKATWAVVGAALITAVARQLVTPNAKATTKTVIRLEDTDTGDKL